MIAFGPVPSRRLGASLGINIISPKVCSYSCLYCQIGRTERQEIERMAFLPVERIVAEVGETLARLRERNERIDYLSFVPDGEPTLDVNLGREIEALKRFGIPVAVITNSSLIGRPDVREDLLKADWVSVKVDAVREEPWRRVNRPPETARLGPILAGIRAFAGAFAGFLATETLLARDANDGEADVRATAAFIATVRPKKAYIGVPTRPPAEPGCAPPPEERVNAAWQAFTEAGLDAELMTGHAAGAFGFTGDAARDILAASAVHPMSEEQVRGLLAKAGEPWSLVERLVAGGALKEIVYAEKRYYLRPLIRK